MLRYARIVDRLASSLDNPIIQVLLASRNGVVSCCKSSSYNICEAYLTFMENARWAHVNYFFVSFVILHIFHRSLDSCRVTIPNELQQLSI